MMIYLFCVAIVIASGFVGKYLSQKYIVRDEFFKELINFSNQLKNDISFKKLKINEIVTSYLEISENKNKSKIAELFGKRNINEQNLRFLKKEEILYIKNFIAGFGGGSAEIETGNLNNFIEQIKNYSSIAENERKKNEKLIFKLSVMVGVVVCILII